MSWLVKDCARLLLSQLGLLIAVGCAWAQEPDGPSRQERLQALDKSIEWLAATRPAADAKLGGKGMDALTWSLCARLHPDESVRQQAREEARDRLGALEPETASTHVALAWWAVLLRSMDDVGLDASPYLAALSYAGVQSEIERMSPTTRLWTRELLRFSGMKIESDASGTAVASAASDTAWTPTVNDAYRIFHEIGAATDLGRAAPQVFDARQLEFARRSLPDLLRVSEEAGDTDAAGEVLIAAALLGERQRPYYGAGLTWLLSRQRADGTYRSAEVDRRPNDPSGYRHVVLVASWALLESLQSG